MINLNELEKEAKASFLNGDADLATAYIVIHNPLENVFGNVCFHCQQAVEKYLKGLLLRKGIQPEKIHDLLVLLRKSLPLYPSLRRYERICDELNDYYIETRYVPGVPEDYSLEEAKKAYRQAEKVVNSVKKILKI